MHSHANAYDVFRTCNEFKGDPTPASEIHRALMKIDGYRFFYTKDVSEVEVPVDPKVLVFDAKKDMVNAVIGNGVFSAQAAMVTKDPSKCWLKDTFCFCVDCMKGNWGDCKFIDDFGCWAEKKMKQKPVKIAAEKSELKQFYDFMRKGGKLKQDQPIIVAYDNREDPLSEEPFKLYLMTQIPSPPVVAAAVDAADGVGDAEAAVVSEYEFPALALSLYGGPPRNIPISAPPVALQPAGGIADIAASVSRTYYVQPGTESVLLPLDKIISPFAMDEMDDKMKREEFLKYVHATVINSNGSQQTTTIVYNVDSRCYANLDNCVEL